MGIVSQAMQAKAPQPGAGQSSQSNALQRIKIAAMEALGKGGLAPQLVQLMQAAGDPATGLAHATMSLMKGLYDNSKGTMPQQVVAPATQAVMEIIAQIGEAAGLFKSSPQLLQQAMVIAVQQVTQEQQSAQTQPAPAAPPEQAAAQPPAPVAQQPGG